jgi:abnormal spindle-like microcephaly-associated protein
VGENGKVRCPGNKRLRFSLYATSTTRFHALALHSKSTQITHFNNNSRKRFSECERTLKKMLQHKYSQTGTPCPVPAPTTAGLNFPNTKWRDSILSDVAGDDTTANIEYTSAFGRSSLTSVKPRRANSATAAGSRRKGNGLGFTIYDDEQVSSGKQDARPATSIASSAANTLAMPARRSAIAQPPQRPKHRVSFAPASSDVEAHLIATEVAPKPRRRMSQVPPRRPLVKHEGLRDETEPRQQKQHLAPLPEDIGFDMTTSCTTILKPARRGTIYIPNEDTTMPSMYMGIFSPIKDLDTRAIVEASAVPDSELTGIAAQMVKKRAPRRQSTIAASPKRGPLQIVSRPVQEAAVVEDRLGQGRGKENVPPGQVRRQDERKEMKPAARRASTLVQRSRPLPLAEDMAKLSLNLEVKPSRLFAATASSLGKAMDRQHSNSTSVRTGWNAGARVSTNDAVAAKKPSPKSIAPEQIQERIVENKPGVPSRFVLPNIKPEVIPQSYPLLTENLATPAMYEDNWLSHQEIAITQLVNNLFEASAPDRDPVGGGMLRIRLLDIYGNADNAMLFKRLQGALLYGALRVPSDALAGATKLNSDVGKRRAFTDLWLTTYDLGCLKAALEAVVGRQCGGASPSGSPSASSRRDNGDEIQASRARHSLRRFIEAFLIRNEDGGPDETSPLSPAAHASWSYQRTLLRSLMLIKLLDSTPTSGCLFQSSSSYKSSGSLLQTLFQMLNPSAGDPIRALGHIGYSVHHVQHPLEEYTYKIQNLAIDLRDGVRLTRLVESLLPASDNFTLEDKEHQPQRDWPWGPLSQQLKFPCLGRATKLHNAQVALNALHNIQGMATLMLDITAEDIVDGFREKTVRLLWALTNKWGLGGLVDWADVEREIKRLRRANSDTDNSKACLLDVSEDGEETGYSRYRTMLVSWAQVIAKTRGVTVTNMTTSFADGRVFESIVDEYERYIIGDNKATDRKQLSERLRGLGCSEQFAGLFTHSDAPSSKRMHIFDRDFVMAALAFLCSRLLGPSKTSRAAVTIQKAWRQHWGRVLSTRRGQLKMLAEGCAAAVGATARQKGVCDKAKDDEAETRCDKAAEVSLDQNADDGDIWLNL